jgi:hypothetical protein
MKSHVALALLLAITPAAEAAVTSQANVSPATGAVGELMVLSFTKTAGYLDGPQRGNVTPALTGAINATLMAKSYNFTESNPLSYKSVTLTWTWTPTVAGNYTITFHDQAAAGTARNAQLSFHVTNTTAGGGDGEVTTMPVVPYLPIAAGLLVATAGAIAFAGRRHRGLRIIVAAALVLLAVGIIWGW